MALKNIELFDLLIPYLANDLYERFPLCKDIILKNILENREIKEVDITYEQKELILSEALFWLEENNFLKFEAPSQRAGADIAYPSFTCVRLTATGINILKTTPDAIRETRTIGEMLHDTVKRQIVEKTPEIGFSIMKKIGESLL